MPESWSFTQQGAGAGGGEVSPGSGSSGFTSRAVIVANGSGQLVDGGTALQWDSTQGFLGIGTTAPATPLDVASTLGMTISTGAAGFNFRGGPKFFATSTGLLQISLPPAANSKITLDSSGTVIRSTANGNTFLVTGTTGLSNPAFCVETTGSTMKMGFWTTAGTTQPAAYTTGTATTVRTLPSTITTVAGLMSAPEREEFNEAVGALNCLILDLKAYGLLK